MSKILYLECHSGISGDMSVAALLDLGADQKRLEKALESMNLPDYKCHFGKTKSYGIEANDFDVHIDEHHHHHHRNLHHINEIIDQAQITTRANILAKKIFKIVAQAEAKVHGVAIDEVHFHEVGALDSIVDIVAVAVCIDDLEITECVVSPLSEGSGFVNCQHGRLPVPVPAVAEICSQNSLPLTITSAQGEMITPTGAAIAAALKTKSVLPKTFTIKGIGLGAGKRDFGHPNILRAMLLECEESSQADKIYILESNIDDSTPEELGLVMEQLFEAGARDVHFVPAFMKKNRPGVLLRVIADASLVPTMEQVIFSGTTTIGIRKMELERTTLERKIVTHQLDVGTIEVKCCRFNDKIFYYPEYESVKKLAKMSDIPFLTLWEVAKKELKEL